MTFWPSCDVMAIRDSDLVICRKHDAFKGRVYDDCNDGLEWIYVRRYHWRSCAQWGGS